MEKNVTFGKLLTILIIVMLPLTYWLWTTTNRVDVLENDYSTISNKVLTGIDKVSNSIRNIEEKLSINDSLNHSLKHNFHDHRD